MPNNYLNEVRLSSVVIKTFLGFFDGGDLVIIVYACVISAC